MPTDRKRKPISESVQFREIVAPDGNRNIEGTVIWKHNIASPPLLDHLDQSEIYRMERDVKRCITNAIDDKLFGDARLVLFRLKDEVERFIESATIDTPGDPIRPSQVRVIERLFDDLKEELA